MGSKTNWAAVSAVAAVGGVLVAFLAYAAPHPTPQPLPTPPSTTAPAQQPGPYPTTPVVPPTQVPATTPAAEAPSQIPGCPKALAIVNTFNQTAGSTQYSRGSAARQAATDLMYLLESLAGGAAYSSISAVYNDLSRLADSDEYARGMDSDQLEAAFSADEQTLFRVCGKP